MDCLAMRQISMLESVPLKESEITMHFFMPFPVGCMDGSPSKCALPFPRQTSGFVCHFELIQKAYITVFYASTTAFPKQNHLLLSGPTQRILQSKTSICRALSVRPGTTFQQPARFCKICKSLNHMWFSCLESFFSQYPVISYIARCSHLSFVNITFFFKCSLIF